MERLEPESHRLGDAAICTVENLQCQEALHRLFLQFTVPRTEKQKDLQGWLPRVADPRQPGLNGVG